MSSSLPFQDVQTVFDRDAEHYERHAPLEKEVAARLMERLPAARGEPQTIIDLGCGTGRDLLVLKSQFPRACVLGVDGSRGMLSRNPSRRWRPFGRMGRSAPRWLYRVQADMARLPIPDQSADLLYSNMSLHFCGDIDRAIAEFSRVLKPHGLLLISGLGRDSLMELDRRAVDSDGSPGSLLDLRNLGDALLSAGFAAPVVDCERIEVSYGDRQTLVGDLGATGLIALLGLDADRTAGRDWSGKVGFEVIYATAFGPVEGQPRRTVEGEVATFSVDALKKTF